MPQTTFSSGLEDRLGQYLPSRGVGKVRNSYALRPEGGRALRLSYASDRVSVFDFVLGPTIPQKGEVLTMMNVFWRLYLQKVLPALHQDLVAYGWKVNEYMPQTLAATSALWKRGLVVEELEIILVEAIARGYLTGTGWEAYQKDGMVCGHRLPAGLKNGSKLEMSLFTPTTKAKMGHDEHITAESVDKKYGPELGKTTLSVYRALRHQAEACGLILVDSKLEFGWRMTDGGEKVLALADEVGTPDSSRI